MDAQIHIYRERWQPLTKFNLSGVLMGFSPRKLYLCHECLDRRQARNLEVQARAGNIPVGVEMDAQIEKVIAETDGSDYLKYRGRCKELAEAEVKADSSLRLVRGYYHCPLWGKQAHWWAERADGAIVDPSVNQFPTKGAGADYEEYDGTIECEFCHKVVPEESAYMYAHHAYCSYECFGHDVGF